MDQQKNHNQQGMESILADPIKRAALKKRLLEYPGTADDQADRIIIAYETRVWKKKDFLVRDSNRAAEIKLDRLGYPRPPGWHSVFFYPDSNTPRYRYVFLTVVCILLWLVLVK